MSSLLSSFQRFIRKNELFKAEDRVLVAVSGGVDSIVLCHLLYQSKMTFGVAHCNFGLRGVESDQDEQLAEELAETYFVDFFVRKFETEKYASTNGISTQMAARDLRYEWFAELISSKGFDKLVTAHHANDQIETALFNLSKGTGIAGLRGILPVNDLLIRPLLFASKDDILAYAKQKNLTWREDASNESDKYHRNKIRHHVIPVLKDINPNLEGTFENTAVRLRSLESLLKSKVEEVKAKYLIRDKNGFTLHLNWFDPATGGLVMLEEILKPFEFNLDQCQNIDASLDHSIGNQFESPTNQLTVDRNKLLIQKRSSSPTINVSIEKNTREIEINEHFFTFTHLAERTDFTTDQNVAYFDAVRVSYPITIRNWCEGDHFRPLGMKSEKKVSDFMIDEKIPVNLKKRLLIFESAGEIIWIAGHRISDLHKITSQTKSSLIIKMSTP